MREEESITEWLNELKLGDQDAVRRIWERYFSQLVELSRRILHAAPRGAADEEDVALSAFESFCRRAAADKFPRLEDRDDLWRILMTITVRKSLRLARIEGKRVTAGAEFWQQQLISEQPSPDFVALVNDQFQSLLSRLRTETFRQIALLKLQSYTNQEIAARLERSVSFVERKLARIRQIWSREDPR